MNRGPGAGRLADVSGAAVHGCAPTAWRVASHRRAGGRPLQTEPVPRPQ